MVAGFTGVSRLRLVFLSPTRCGRALVYFPTLLRTIIFFPVTMSLVAVGLMFLLILNPIFGAFDTLLRSARAGVSRPRMVRRLSHRDLHTGCRRRLGVHRAADDLLFRRSRRCAKGDIRRGAHRGRGSFSNDVAASRLPQLRPVTAVVVMLTLFESLKAFDLIAVMTKGAPFGRTNVLGLSRLSRELLEFALRLRRDGQRRHSCSSR